jgi:hypothetical protein
MPWVAAAMLWKQLSPRYRSLLRNGQRGEAVVVSAEVDRTDGTSGGMGRDGLAGLQDRSRGGVYGWNVTLRATFPDGRSADFERYLEAASAPQITPGMTLPIRFDPAKPSRVEVDLPALESE